MAKQTYVEAAVERIVSAFNEENQGGEPKVFDAIRRELSQSFRNGMKKASQERGDEESVFDEEDDR